MTTVRDIVERAHRKIGVAPLDEPLTAEMADNGLDAFNEMLSAWALDGITLSPAFTDATLADTFPLADKFREGTVYLLAERLRPDYTRPATFNADDFFRKIQAAYTVIPTVTVPSVLLRTPSQRDVDEAF